MIPRLLCVFSLLPLLAACQTMAIGAATTTATVAAEERSFGEAVDDGAIYLEINHYFVQTDVRDLLPNVNIIIRQGRVMLTGQVDKPETAGIAVREAWKAKGVKEVINEIDTTPSPGIVDRANDELAEKNLEARLTITKGVNILNYSVDVVNKTAFLLGYVATEDELNRVLNVARSTKGIRRVVSHLRLPNQYPDANPNPADDGRPAWQ